MTGVYLDVGFPGFRGDAILLKTVSNVEPGPWYISLNLLFDFIENSLNLKFNVLAHPKHEIKTEKSNPNTSGFIRIVLA